ncbi:MAG: tyrosine-type recombinase/integrase [Pseudomonadota bacterium]
MQNAQIARNGRSGYYEARWSEQGRSRTQSLRTKDHGVAMERLQELQAADRKLTTAATGLSLRDICEQYVREKPQQDHSLRLIVREFGDLHPDDLDHAELYSYRLARETRVEPSTVRREFSALTAALNWAKKPRNRLLPKDFVVDIELPPNGAPRREFMPEALEAQVYEFAQARALSSDELKMRRAGVFVCIALRTAARKQAIQDLTWQRVDLVSGLIQFQEPDRAENRKRRPTVPVAQDLLPVLEHTWGLRDENNPFVLGSRGDTRKGVKRLLREAGAGDYRTHDLRRTWASLRANWGVPMEEIAAVLGDDVATTRKHYAHLQPGYLASAVNARGRIAA